MAAGNSSRYFSLIIIITYSSGEVSNIWCANHRKDAASHTSPGTLSDDPNYPVLVDYGGRNVKCVIRGT